MDVAVSMDVSRSDDVQVNAVRLGWDEGLVNGTASSATAATSRGTAVGAASA